MFVTAALAVMGRIACVPGVTGSSRQVFSWVVMGLIALWALAVHDALPDAGTFKKGLIIAFGLVVFTSIGTRIYAAAEAPARCCFGRGEPRGGRPQPHVYRWVNFVLNIDYQAADGKETARTVTVHRVDGRWMKDRLFLPLDLHGYCHLRKAVRTFRVDRIETAADADRVVI